MTIVMDSPKLRGLTRTQLQSLAKREVIRAIGKTEDIIRRLMKKHPEGVPVEDCDVPSASLTPPKQGLPKEFGKDTPLSPILQPTGHHGPKEKGKMVVSATSPSPSGSTETLELLYPDDEPVAGPSKTYATVDSRPRQQSQPDRPVCVPPLEHTSHETRDKDQSAHNPAQPPAASNPGWRTEEDEEGDADEISYEKGAPTHYMVVDALRQFTTLVNAVPIMEARIAEHRCILRRTEALLEKATPNARELTVTREYLETFLLAKMKTKRELWDGTAKMEKQARKIRMQWLRAERKAENEKKWREVNESNRKDGLEQVPFSVFASESDEEVIESLQTTPESSRSGSAKRGREKSSDVDSDGDSGERRKKKACL